MEPRFEAVTVQTKDAYRSTVLADYILHQKTPTAVFYVMALLLGGFLWWGNVYSNDRAAPLVLMIVSAVITAAICIAVVPYLDRFAIKRKSQLITGMRPFDHRDIHESSTFLESIIGMP